MNEAPAAEAQLEPGAVRDPQAAGSHVGGGPRALSATRPLLTWWVGLVWAGVLGACRAPAPDLSWFPPLAADALTAVDRCAMDTQVSLDGLSVAALYERCGAFLPLYDERGRRLIGLSTEGDSLVAVIARMADDVQHLHRTLVKEDHPGEAQIMLEHIRVSSGALRRRVAEIGSYSARAAGCAAPEDHDLLRENGRVRVENLRTTLRQYGTVHKAHPELVRHRMLEVYGLSAVAWLRHEQARWGAGCPPQGRPLLEALQPVVDTFERARARLRSAEVRTDEEAEALQQELERAAQGWGAELRHPVTTERGPE